MADTEATVRARAAAFVARVWGWHTITAIQAERDLCLQEIAIVCDSAPLDEDSAADMLENRIQHMGYLRVRKHVQIRFVLRNHGERATA